MLKLSVYKMINCILVVLVKHWIRLEMQSEIVIQSLRMKVDPCDSSYMPSLVVVSGGNSFTALTELATVHVRNTNTIVTLITNVKKVSVLLK